MLGAFAYIKDPVYPIQLIQKGRSTPQLQLLVQLRPTFHPFHSHAIVSPSLALSPSPELGLLNSAEDPELCLSLLATGIAEFDGVWDGRDHVRVPRLTGPLLIELLAGPNVLVVVEVMAAGEYMGSDFAHGGLMIVPFPRIELD
ncbi:hypothetical protein MMC28_000191 [Mycoblastus sanguinarius]|nr:hypothetical protein [Mycoblastus sanguinarius]